ncbi:hypothetical protein [Candidatus Binatus sp.]|uniref:hypothetical protein n=1 Tax=Candidatus Binatus sp. TaxID=2811406 RepID=UPI003C82EFDA
MQKHEANGKADIDGYRKLVAGAVDLEVGELTGAKRDDPNVAIRRKIAAYIVHQDRMPLGDVAGILDESESFVRYSIDDIERRISNYLAFKLSVDRMLGTYARACIEAGKVSDVRVDGIRLRIASRVGMTVTELVALESNNDSEIVQKVAAYMLLSHDRLSAAEVAEVMFKGEQWVLSAKGYVERDLRRGDQGLRISSRKRRRPVQSRTAQGIGGSKFLESRIR